MKSQLHKYQIKNLPSHQLRIMTAERYHTLKHAVTNNVVPKGTVTLYLN